MAGTTAPARKRKRAKQKRLEGIEPEGIKEVDDAAENYRDARDERMGLTDKEVEAKQKLIDVMKKHKLEIYKGDGFTVTYNSKLKEDVKVQTAEESEGEADEE